MEDLKLVEKRMVKSAVPTAPRRIFLSNIDLTLAVYQETVSLFDPPENQMSFSEIYECLCGAVSQLIVHYDFVAGRLVPSQEASDRLEIDCNNAGYLVVAATTKTKLSELGELMTIKPEYRQCIAFVQDEIGDDVELQDKPLALFQLTQFGCGSLALALRYNHCMLDGVAIHLLELNLASLTRGEGFVVVPNPDRTMFRARNPPQIKFPHFEYSKASDTDSSFTRRRSSAAARIPAPVERPWLDHLVHPIHVSQSDIEALKKAALRDGKLKECTTFQAVAARVWKARSIAMEMPEEKISTILFPVDFRARIVPRLPKDFAGNAVIPGYARTSVKELKEAEYSSLVKRVQEGIERIDSEYVMSCMDWLEVHAGVPNRVDSFSLVSWWRLGLGQEYGWGRLRCATPAILKPGMVFILPGPTSGSINIFIKLEAHQVAEFQRIMNED